MYSFDRLHYSTRGSYFVWDSRNRGVLKLDMIHNHGQDIFNGILSINYGKKAKMGFVPREISVKYEGGEQKITMFGTDGTYIKGKGEDFVIEIARTRSRFDYQIVQHGVVELCNFNHNCSLMFVPAKGRIEIEKTRTPGKVSADYVDVHIYPDENGEYVLLNGNETGCILLYYILLKKKENGSLKSNATAVKTIVTTDLIFDMAQEFGINVNEVLTGFKYIGEAMDTLENYLFGLEESYGYLIGTHARDKDAVSAAMLIAEACAYFKGEGKSLYAVLGEIYERYGYYTTSLKSVSMPGKDGMERMAELLKSIRQNPLKQLGGKELVFDDFKDGIFGLPKSDVLRFKNNDYRLIIRPSGTEPKIKIYMQARGVTPEKSAEMIEEMDTLFKSLMK